MLRLVEEAQNQKAAVQRLADRIAGIFVPSVIAFSLITLAGWLLTGSSSEPAFNAALSVLIIACPCALGLATPTALLVASGLGATLGIFFKGYQALEVSRQIDTVLLDKTGTLTDGHMSVAEVATAEGIGVDELLQWAGSLEQASEHLVAKAIVKRARLASLVLSPADEFTAMPGLGARAVVDGHGVAIGRPALFDSSDVSIPMSLSGQCEAWEALGRTVVVVGRDEAVVGAISLSDSVRSSAKAAVKELQALGLRCVLVTGDNERAAQVVAQLLGMDEVIASALPSEKVATIRTLQAAGHTVAMVGDGINDGPALATADLGIAVGSGTDVARNAADLIIVRDDLGSVPTAIRLARRTHMAIRGNLAWAFAYNVVAIPLAACGLLNPLIAGAAMALSSGCVVWNSARLRHFSRTSKPKAFRSIRMLSRT